MIKFFKKKANPAIRTVRECWGDGTEIGRMLGVIGQVKELLKEEIIFSDNTNGNEDKWLVVRTDDNNTIYEFNSLAEAKEYCVNHHTEWC